MSSLNDDQFESRLYGMLRDEEDDEVLTEDQEDDADLMLMREAISHYKSETLHFAEQKSAGLPAPRVPKVLALWDSTPRWAVASTAVLALGFSMALITHRNTEPAAMTMAAAPTAQALSDDNRLLLSVDEALSGSTAPTEADLGLTAAPAHGTRHGRATN